MDRKRSKPLSRINLNLKLKTSIVKSKRRGISRLDSFFDKRKRMQSPLAVKFDSTQLLSPTEVKPRHPRFFSPELESRLRQVYKLNMTFCSKEQVKYMTNLDEKVKMAKLSRFTGLSSPLVLKRKFYRNAYDNTPLNSSDGCEATLPDLAINVNMPVKKALFSIKHSQYHECLITLDHLAKIFTNLKLYK